MPDTYVPQALIAPRKYVQGRGLLSSLGTYVRELGQDALVLADCVTSLGGIPVDIDGWGIDVAYSGTQKCLGVSPGLAPFTLGPVAWERRNAAPQSWYLDLGMIGDYTSGAARKYHHTAPIAIIISLHAALVALLD